MVIIKVMGGLGNQLQQYALYEKMLSLGKEAALDVTWFEDTTVQQRMLAPRKLELEYFDDLTYRKATEAEIRKACGANGLFGKVYRKLLPGKNHRFQETQMYHPEIFHQDVAYLEGYWAANKYYADILPVLQHKLSFPTPNQENQALAKQMQEDAYPVCMHVRRGDYLDQANQALFGGICTPQYYEGAIGLIKAQHPEATFYVFSDDQDYVRKEYAAKEFYPVELNHGTDSFYDIWLMSQCKAHICANSTFSFWGARLNPQTDKVMIRPSKHKNNQEFHSAQMHDLWPDWLLIDPKGEVV